MKRQFRKTPILCSKAYDEKGIITTEDDMSDFLEENDVIINVIEEVNDNDPNWEYDTPAKFAAACEKRFKATLKERIADYGYKVKGDPNKLVSKKFLKALKAEASSGDFDVDASTSICSAASGRDSNKTYSSIKFSGWSASKTKILEVAGGVLNAAKPRDKKARKDELIRDVRYSLSEAENVAAKMEEYANILSKFNSSSKSDDDVEKLIDALGGFKLSQNDKSKQVNFPEWDED